MLRTTTTSAPHPTPSEIFADTSAKILNLQMEARKLESLWAIKALNRASAGLKRLEAGNFVSPVSAKEAVRKEVRRHLILAGDLLRRAAEADKAAAAHRAAAPSETEEWVAGIIGRPLPKRKVA